MPTFNGLRAPTPKHISKGELQKSEGETLSFHLWIFAPFLQLLKGTSHQKIMRGGTWLHVSSCSRQLYITGTCSPCIVRNPGTVYCRRICLTHRLTFSQVKMWKPALQVLYNVWIYSQKTSIQDAQKKHFQVVQSKLPFTNHSGLRSQSYPASPAPKRHMLHPMVLAVGAAKR